MPALAGWDQQPAATRASATRATDTSPRRSQRHRFTPSGRGAHIATTATASTTQARTRPAAMKRLAPPSASAAAARLQAITAIPAARWARPSVRASGSPYQNQGAWSPMLRAFSVCMWKGLRPTSS